MAQIEDRWRREIQQPDGTKAKLPTTRDGKGRRWSVRYRSPDGEQIRRTFERRADAEAFAVTTQADILRGTYVSPKAGVRTFDDYAREWLARQTTDPASVEAVANRLRRYVTGGSLGNSELRKIKPGAVQAWIKAHAHLAPNTLGAAFTVVSAVLSAAVDDELIPKNPASAATVRVPRPERRKVTPWPTAWVLGMRDALPDRYDITAILGGGLGLRQGEIFGLAAEDIDFLRGWVHVRRQVKYLGYQKVFGPPKGGKTRDVPLPGSVRDELAAHLARFPAQPVTLPWATLDGRQVTASLMVTGPQGGAVDRSTFRTHAWVPARKAVGIPQTRENGMHALRHHYASVLLNAGESIKALSEYLGHASARVTLDVYSHVMPTSETRTRSAVDAAFSCDPSVTQAGGETP